MTIISACVFSENASVEMAVQSLGGSRQGQEDGRKNGWRNLHLAATSGLILYGGRSGSDGIMRYQKSLDGAFFRNFSRSFDSPSPRLWRALEAVEIKTIRILGSCGGQGLHYGRSIGRRFRRISNARKVHGRQDWSAVFFKQRPVLQNLFCQLNLRIGKDNDL